MKYLSENQHTFTSLKSWAGTTQLYTASYYFWNQGNDMQKSRTGLMQSLLYQVLRSAPQSSPPFAVNVLRKRGSWMSWLRYSTASQVTHEARFKILLLH
jgi:hypothetical protein